MSVASNKKESKRIREKIMFRPHLVWDRLNSRERKEAFAPGGRIVRGNLSAEVLMRRRDFIGTACTAAASAALAGNSAAEGGRGQFDRCSWFLPSTRYGVLSRWTTSRG